MAMTVSTFKFARVTLLKSLNSVHGCVLFNGQAPPNRSFRSASAVLKGAQDNQAEREPLVVRTHCNGVTTLRMNRPAKLNSWTGPMMNDLFLNVFVQAASDDETKVLIVTGTGRYYCAGVDLSSTIRPMHPRKLHTTIYEKNKQLFESFLKFPKPILIAANGPAVGASVTSASLCDAVIAVDTATFSTPFHALGVPAEGCSSYYFPQIMGDETASRMLGEEGWKPTAEEAKAIGLIEFITTSEKLQEDAQRIAEEWVKQGKTRHVKTEPMGDVQEHLLSVNDRESKDLAEAFLSSKFIMQQHEFLKSKGKTNAARTFWLLNFFRPLWAMLL